MKRPFRLIIRAFPQFSLVAILLALATNVMAQDVIRCYTMEHDSMWRAQYELPPMEEFEEWLQPKVKEYKVRQTNRRAEVVTLPVVFHIIHDSESQGTGENISNAQVYSQIDVLNEDFRRNNPDASDTRDEFTPVAADCEMEFCLAGITRTDRNDEGWSAPPFTKCTVDTLIKPATIWDPEQYINIWVIPGLNRCDGTGNLLGYSTWPEASGLTGVSSNDGIIEETDGIVVIASSVGRPPDNPFTGRFNLGRTATHELGHFFGLRHIWGDGDCSDSDYCDDTPDADGPNTGCPFDANSCEDESDDLPDMVENFLDYTDDACMNTFTEDQKTRMRTVLDNSPRRAELLTANTCCPTGFASASVTSDYNGEDLSCAGASDGEATASTSGGTAPYDYEWSDGQTGQTATGLSAGTYEVTVTDDLGCPSVASVTLTDPPSVSASVSVTSNHNGEAISCAGACDGELTASASGGAAPYSFQWDAAARSATSATVARLCAGTYSVTVTDANGCTEIASGTLNDPAELTANAEVTSDFNGADISCHGASDGEAEAFGSGGTGSYSYEWSDGQTGKVATGLSASTYDVTITDDNNCEATASVTLTEPDPVTASATPTSDYNGYHISCFGGSDGSAKVTAGGGTPPYTYSWDANAGSQTTAEATNLSAGTYSVTVSDANGCSQSTSVTLTEPDELVVDAGENQTVYFGYPDSACADLEVSAASGGVPPYTFTWSDGAAGDSTNVCPEVTTVYEVTITDQNGCTATDLVTVCVIDVHCGNNPNNHKVEICHTKGKNAHSQCVSIHAVPAHLAHGDLLGNCNVDRSCDDVAAKWAGKQTVSSTTIEAYPNPFGNETEIAFTVDRDGHAIVELFDISGRMINQLFRGEIDGGHTYKSTVAGHQLTAGLYFCRLQFADGTSEVVKLVYAPEAR